MKKIQLALLFTIFGLGLHGMEPKDTPNTFNLSRALKHGAKLPEEQERNCIIAYFKSTSAENSAEEMFTATKQAIEKFATKVKNVNNDTHVLLFPNKKLTIDKDHGFDTGNRIIPEERVNFAQFIVQKNKWRDESQLSQTGYAFTTQFGNSADGCKLTAYMVPRNNLIPMKHHLRQIHGLCHHGAPMVIIADSALEDDIVRAELAKENLICATFGAPDKQPTCTKCSQFSSLSRGIALVFIVGGVLIIFSRLWAYKDYLDRINMGYVGEHFYFFGRQIFCDWLCHSDNKATIFHFLHS